MEAKISDKPARRRRSDGERSRGAILTEAARLATVEGLNGLTLARLAEAVGMSKSGLFAHFGSKEDLQLATVEHARSVFAVEVLLGASDARGIARLRKLCENFLRHVERRTFPGGCFFASATAELGPQSGPVRDRVLEVENDFVARLRAAAEEAQKDGDLPAAEDPDQLAFELTAYLALANTQFAVSQDPGPIERARNALDRRLGSA